MNYVFRRLVLGDVSREWTDVARQRRRRYQFAASNIISIARGLANRHGVALHAAPTTPAASTATASAAPAVTSIALVTSALALCCPGLHDMFSESLGIFRLEIKSANYASLQNLFASRSSDQSFPRKASDAQHLTVENVSFFSLCPSRKR